MRSHRASVSHAQILLVDDDPLVAKGLARLLVSQAYTVTVVNTGSAALAHLESEGADLVVCDGMMPGIDGIELARALRSSAEWCDTSVILVSGLDDRETRVRAQEVGDAFMLKPVDALELCIVIDRLLARSRLLAALRRENSHLHAELAALLSASRRAG